MLKPIQVQFTKRVLTPSKAELQNSSVSKPNILSGQAIASPLSEFMNSDEADEVVSGEEHQTGGESTETANEILVKTVATLIPAEHEEYVADLLEAVSDLVVEKDQKTVFEPVSTQLSDGSDASVEVTLEATGEVSVEITAPAFVQSEDIAKLVSTSTNIWSYTGLELVEKTVMLLKNGMAYKNLTGSPGTLEIPSFIEAADDNLWTTWYQDETGAIFLGSADSSQETPLVGDEIDLTPLSNADIAGTHTKVKSETWGASQVTTWSDVTFNEDGTFELAESELSTTGGTGSLLVDTFTSSFRHLSANKASVTIGGHSELSGPGDVVAIRSKRTDQEQNTNMYGSYKLAEDGLSIELTFADGSVESRLVYKSDGYVHFGESSFKTQADPANRLEFLRNLSRSVGSGDNRAGWLAVFADSAAEANRQSASQQSGAPNVSTESGSTDSGSTGI